MPYIRQFYHAPVMFETGTTARLSVPHIKCCPNDNNLLRAIQNEFGNRGLYMGTGVLLLSQETCVVDCSAWAVSASNNVQGDANYVLTCLGVVGPTQACQVTIDSNKYRRQGMGALTTALESHPLLTIPTTPTPSLWWQSSNWTSGAPLQLRTPLRDIASAFDTYAGGANSFYLLVDTVHISLEDDMAFSAELSQINYMTFFKTAVRTNVYFVGDTSCINPASGSLVTHLMGLPITTDIPGGSVTSTSKWCTHACHSVLQSFSTAELKNSNDGYIYFSPVFGKVPGQQIATNNYLPRYIAIRVSLVSTKESTPYSGSWA